jgi:hypothetical protein
VIAGVLKFGWDHGLVVAHGKVIVIPLQPIAQQSWALCGRSWTDARPKTGNASDEHSIIRCRPAPQRLITDVFNPCGAQILPRAGLAQW